MKSFVGISLILLLIAPSQKGSDGIVGTWLTHNKNSRITVYKSGKAYYGKITWVLDNVDPSTGKPYLDGLNPKKSERNKPVLGLVAMKNFSYDKDSQRWEKGTLYNPRTGRTYHGYFKLISPNKLKLRGHWGISFLGRTEYWTRWE